MLKALKEYYQNWRTINSLKKRSDCYISYKAHFNIESASQILIGNGSGICAGTVICSQGYDRSKQTRLVIGENTYIGENNNIRISDAEIRIGDNCLISQMVSLICSNHRIPARDSLIMKSGLDMEKIGIVIGNDVWIGCNSVILPGVTIGNGAIVGAGSVVRTNIPEYAIAAGNPAKIIRYRI